LKAVARSFGFSSPPRVNINIESKAAHTRKAQKTGGQGADYRRMKTGGWVCDANALRVVGLSQWRLHVAG
jgi:ATP-dependent RNA helicase DDX18/HAS1